MSPWYRRRHAIADRPLNCRKVGEVLQSFLDGHTDARMTAKVAEHLEDCRRCGLEASVYREIKASLAKQSPALPESTLDRLRWFARELEADRTDGNGEGAGRDGTDGGGPGPSGLRPEGPR